MRVFPKGTGQAEIVVGETVCNLHILRQWAKRGTRACQPNHSRGAAVKLECKLRNERVHGRASRALTSIHLLLGNNILPCFDSMSSERTVMEVRRQEGITARTDSTLARANRGARKRQQDGSIVLTTAQNARARAIDIYLPSK